MHGVGEHVHRLDGRNHVFLTQDGQVPGLGGRVAANVYHPVRFRVKDHLGHVRVDAGAGRVQDNDIGPSVGGDKGVVQHVFHVSGKELAVGDPIGIGIGPGIFDGFRNILNAKYFSSFPAHELGYGAGAGIEVIDHLVSR